MVLVGILFILVRNIFREFIFESVLGMGELEG